MSDEFSVKPSRDTKVRDSMFEKKTLGPLGGRKCAPREKKTCKKDVCEKDAHVVMLADKEQDTAVFWHCLQPIIAWYIMLLGSITCLFFSSDHCAGQFHGRKNYARIAAFHEIVPGAFCIWNLDCAKHGKGPADGDGAVVKREARGLEHGTSTASGGEQVRMHDSEAVYKGVAKALSFGFTEGYEKWMTKEELSAVPDKKGYNPDDLSALTRRGLWFYGPGSVNHKGLPDYTQVAGSTQYHSFRGTGKDVDVIMCRRFTCSCGACMRFDWDQCETRELIGVWDAKKKKYCNDWVRRTIRQLSGRGVSTHRSAAKAARAAEVKEMVKDVTEDTFIAINCGRDTQGFCYWLGKAAKAPYKAVHDWTDHSGTKIKKGDFVIDLIYWDRPSTDDPLLFEDEAKKATVHAEHVLHANVAPTAAADDRVRVSEAVVAEIEAEYEVFLNT